MGACSIGAKHGIIAKQSRARKLKLSPIIFMGGPRGAPHKNGGRRAQPMTQAKQSGSKPSTYGKQVKSSKKKKLDEIVSKLSRVYQLVLELTKESLVFENLINNIASKRFKS